MDEHKGDEQIHPAAKPSPSIDSGESSHGHRPGTREAGNAAEQARFDKWPALTFWITLVYTATTILLWLTTRESVEVTRRSVEISQRAWLVATQFAALKEAPGATDRTIPVPLAVENVGRTPALYAQGGYALICATSPPEQLDWSIVPHEWKNEATIGPGQHRGFVKTFTLHPQCSMGDVLSGARSLVTYGYLLYWDEFGTTRGLTFCGTYNPEGRKFEFCGHDNIPW